MRAAAAFALALALFDSAAAQERVRSARLVADLTAGDGSASVRVEYVLDGVVRGAAPIEARALDFGEAVVEDVRAGSAGGEVALERGPGLVRRASLRAEGEAGAERIVASYGVARAAVDRRGAVRGHVPVLTLARPPEQTRPGLFAAELRLPPGWAVLEGFPTGLAATGEPGVYRVELPVIPAVLSFRARADGTWRPGLAFVLDGVAVAFLLAFALVGFRHLRRSES